MPQGENFPPGVIIEDLGARLTRLFKTRGKIGDYLGLGTEIVPTYDVADLLSRQETQAGLDLVNARFDLRVAPVENLRVMPNLSTLAADQYLAATSETTEPVILFNQYTRMNATQSIPRYGGVCALTPSLTDLEEGLYLLTVVAIDTNVPSGTAVHSYNLIQGKFSFPSPGDRYTTVTDPRSIDLLALQDDGLLQGQYLVPISEGVSVNGFALQLLTATNDWPTGSAWGFRCFRVLTTVPTLPLDA